MTRAQAFLIEGVNAPFKLTDIDLDEPLDNEVLVKITACGLCHTDFLIPAGIFPSPYPCTVGHEGSGIVVSVGSGVKSVQKGDSVLLSFAHCGECGYCKEGKVAACKEFYERNFGRVRNASVGARPVGKIVGEETEVHGTFFGQSSLASHCLAVESSVVKVPLSTDLSLFAPFGCGLQSGAGAVLNLFQPKQDETVVIFGLGAVGFGAFWSAVHLGIKTIIVVDLLESRLSLASSQGATHTFLGSSPSLVADIHAATGGMGTHYAVECTGVARVLRSAWEAVRNGGKVCSVGNPGPGVPPPFDINDQVNTSKSWCGLVEGDSNPPEFIPRLMKLHANGEFPVETISRVYPVADFDKAVADMKKGEVIKPIISFA